MTGAPDSRRKYNLVRDKEEIGMPKKKKTCIKLIANPEAGVASDPTQRLDETTRYLMDLGFEVDVTLIKPKNEATPIARKAAKKGYPIVIAYGGDGTIEAVARGLVGTNTRLGIIPCGTENNVAKSLGIPTDLQAACALIKEKPKRRIDIGRLKTKKKKPFYFIEVAAIGLTAALYPEGKNIKQDLEHLNFTSIVEVAKTFIHYQTPTLMVILDKESRLKVESMLAVISNTPSFGYGFMISPNASLDDGKLDISLYSDFSKPELIAYFAKIAGTDVKYDQRIQRFRARKIKIKTNPKLDIMSDGVMLGKGTIEIKVLPKALKVIAPANAGITQKSGQAGQQLPSPLSPVPGDTTQEQIEEKEQEQEMLTEKLKETYAEEVSEK